MKDIKIKEFVVRRTRDENTGEVRARLIGIGENGREYEPLYYSYYLTDGSFQHLTLEISSRKKKTP